MTRRRSASPAAPGRRRRLSPFTAAAPARSITAAFRTGDHAGGPLATVAVIIEIVQTDRFRDAAPEVMRVQMSRATGSDGTSRLNPDRA